jgi:3-isopropylmalate/(R)-2-methylmalate dehydratase small subunit
MTVSQGRAWKFDGDVSSDELISARHVFEFDEKMLGKHLLEEVRPEVAREAQPGDLLVCAGAFAHGSNHSHPFIAMKALGLGLLTRSLSRGPFRLAIFFGIPFLIVGDDVLQSIADGDRIDVDFATGVITSVTTGARHQAERLSPFLQEIVDAGGGLEHGRRQLAQRGG